MPAAGRPGPALLPPFVTVPRTGLNVSRLAFGGENAGMSSGLRSQGLMRALKAGGCNTVVLNLNELADRRNPTSPLYVRDDVSQAWEVRRGAAGVRALEVYKKCATSVVANFVGVYCVR